ncbi:hypothetical protein M413DRAFT_74710, partial [Hebeloma cylindrosporum]
FPFPVVVVHSVEATMPNGFDSAARPRGLWKARGTLLANHAPEDRPFPSISYHNLVVDSLGYLDPDSESFPDRCCSGDESDYSSSSSFLRKRRRLASDSPLTSSEEDNDVQYWDYSRKCGDQDPQLTKWATRSKLMDTSSTVGPGQPSPDRTTCDLEDWQDLKELFAKAAELYENQSPAESISLLRGVIHECHRFLKAYQDPSVLYATPEKSPAVPVTPPPGRQIKEDWFAERPLYPPPNAEKLPPIITHPGQEKEKKCKCKDLPTSFYTILGTTLFFFGNLIEQEPSLALEGEPVVPTPYWLSALDVFETGENLPIRTSGRGCPSAPEDWRMATIWGRTLVNLAEEVLRRQKESNARGKPLRPPTPEADFIISPPGQWRMPTELPKPPSTNPDEPNWPPSSPFAVIASRRPPISTRIDLARTTPHELLLMAQDQFSRGIFHMPHPLQPAQASSSSTTITPTPKTEDDNGDDDNAVNKNLLPPETFSRAKELYTIALEIFLVAEKLEIASERATWASWADSVFSQMKMEADMDAWRANITSARGRCHLIVGSALAEEVEAQLAEGNEDEGVWDCDDARDARDALAKAIAFLEKAREAVVQDRMDTEVAAELSSLLAEALLTLANLTKDKAEREALYSRAQKEGGDAVAIELDSDDDQDDDDDRMDESV